MRRLSSLEAFLTGALGATVVVAALGLLLEPSRIATRPASEGPPRTTPRAAVVLDASVPAVAGAELAETEKQAAETAWDTTEAANAEELAIESPVEVEPGEPVAAPVAEQPAREVMEVDEEEIVESEIGDASGEPVVADEPAPAPVACGPVTCPAEWVCCNESCGICTRRGDLCSQRPCNMPMIPMSVSCGPITCNVGELCCDPWCGRCVRPGEPCAGKTCLSPIDNPFSESCGMATCNVGTVCCNPSCGICARPGVPCSKRVCR